MARTKSIEQARTKSKTAAVDEVNRGIEKLMDLMAQIEDLSRDGFPYRDAVRSRTELSLRETIRRIFGEKSEEYQTYKSHKIRASHRAESAQTIAVLKQLVAQLEQQKLDLLGARPAPTDPSPPTHRNPDTPSFITVPSPEATAGLTAGKESMFRTAQSGMSSTALAANPDLPSSAPQSIQPVSEQAQPAPTAPTCAPQFPKAESLSSSASTATASHLPIPPAEPAHLAEQCSRQTAPTPPRDMPDPQTASTQADPATCTSKPDSTATTPAEFAAAAAPAVPLRVDAAAPTGPPAESSRPVSSLGSTMAVDVSVSHETGPVPPVWSFAPVPVQMPAPLRADSSAEHSDRLPNQTSLILPVPGATPAGEHVPVTTPGPLENSELIKPSTQAVVTSRDEQTLQPENGSVFISKRTPSRPDPDAAFHPDDPVAALRKICSRFHLVARQLRLRRDYRATLEVEDEYDVQDLLYALLRLEFEEVGSEDWCPGYGDGGSRTSYLLHKERVVIVSKKTKTGMTSRDLMEQVKADSSHYSGRSDCRTLVCFIYDPEGRIGNPRGLESDLTIVGDTLTLEVIIAPK